MALQHKHVSARPNLWVSVYSMVAQGVRLVAGLVNTKRQVPGAQSEKDTTDGEWRCSGLDEVVGQHAFHGGKAWQGVCIWTIITHISSDCRSLS